VKCHDVKTAIGTLDKSQTSYHLCGLEPGDFVCLFSDGVSDNLGRPGLATIMTYRR
jgi:serine phosphatase RsbU (regulator of sigma subunit)